MRVGARRTSSDTRCSRQQETEPNPHEQNLKKKREELARVQQRLADPDLRPGIAREQACGHSRAGNRGARAGLIRPYGHPFRSVNRITQ